MINRGKRTAAYWVDWFEERAAILQYDGGYNRLEAEQEAQKMLERHGKELWGLSEPG